MDVLNEVSSSSYFVLLIAGMVLIGLIVIGLIFAKLYKRATKEMAFVRTGFGGEKIIKDGGAIVLPVLHETIAVNMNTLRIEVEKTQKDALITKDRMRVDVKADFYLRVAPNADGISMAAQTLGTRTTRVEELKKLMESKFVDVLRAVAAEMTMTEMHEQRADFVQRVQNNVANDLEKNGLELESVSLTGFDQTDLQFFNENNAFDAEGRARLAKIIEEKRKETNDIQQENRIKIEQRNLEAEKESLEIEKAEEEARLIQQQSLEFKRADQKAEIIKQKENKAREEREAEIAKERAIETAEIEKTKDIETREIEKHKSIEQSRIQQQRDIEVAEQEKRIAVAAKSEEESAARARAAEAEKLKVEKEEAVITARQVAEANRRKEIEVIDARKEAERDAVGVTVQAEAEKRAAEDRSSAILIEARASADAKKLQAEADEKVYAVEAAGKQALYEAENVLRDEQIALQKSLAILKALPEIVAQAVKPLENIEGIKILQGYGAGHQFAAGGDGTAINQGGIAEQVTSAALNYRANAPVVDAMLRELGLVQADSGTLNDLLNGNNALTTEALNVVKSANTGLNGYRQQQAVIEPKISN
ncbi:flotillin family protein [Shewanella oneidensis MR-1]|uniref:Negative regulator of univalent cation permeability n=1 Tax=Shewanella oneidensis (strain ATCC 700550 / JCM 31522 / CIP 106686 / LMG 19005 / NCIMB 14063 / MR-1) TaxID=211586 RepID=Q8EH53_SHEON|nr:flotillin domain-containing protein [Shewanella oneidensis]AAN54442.1 putative negative regulator of univalent cation permeability [Shewanella oneidensis MR-1]MDX5996787.1 flotillin domain-containing protein [Shewanella oneidensis]MEE2026503.1 Inner membrane protein YqiK [Shewanella oneidensis]QKG96134.1 flotillin family protein [Shewanella oneidensis MR-1]